MQESNNNCKTSDFKNLNLKIIIGLRILNMYLLVVTSYIHRNDAIV